MWCVGKLDEEYIAKMEDVLKIYERPLSKSEPVVCVDEKPVVLHRDTRAMMPMHPGKVARRDYEYKRCGTANVFCGIEPKAGVHFTKVTPTRCSPEFADFILEIAAHYSAADTIHLVLDNLSTHTRKALTDRFGEEIGRWLWNRFTVHYTPTHGSWLNQAEIEISLFGRQCLGRRRIGDIGQLRRQTKAWNRRTNRDRITIRWKFTRKQARRTLNYSTTRS
jgi:transposase